MTWTVFRTISKCYLYDRNINSVVEIPESDYIELNSAHISENLWKNIEGTGCWKIHNCRRLDMVSQI